MPAPKSARSERTTTEDFVMFAAVFSGEIAPRREDTTSSELLNREALDYSLDSLHIVDAYLGELHAHFASMPSEDVEPLLYPLVLWCGAYVGEVIRRAAAPDQYRWVDYDTILNLVPQAEAFLGPEDIGVPCFADRNGASATRSSASSSSSRADRTIRRTSSPRPSLRLRRGRWPSAGELSASRLGGSMSPSSSSSKSSLGRRRPPRLSRARRTASTRS